MCNATKPKPNTVKLGYSEVLGPKGFTSLYPYNE